MSKVHVNVRSIGEVQKFQNSTFQKKEILCFTIENQTPLKIEFTGNNIDLLDPVMLGNDLIIEYNIRGNYFDKKDKSGKIIGKDIINSLVGYKLTIV